MNPRGYYPIATAGIRHEILRVMTLCASRCLRGRRSDNHLIEHDSDAAKSRSPGTVEARNASMVALARMIDSNSAKTRAVDHTNHRLEPAIRGMR